MTEYDPQSGQEKPIPLASSPPPTAQESLSLRLPPPQVMRLSRKMVALLGGGLALAIAGAFALALQSRQIKPPDNLLSTDNPAKAENITSAPRDYTQAPKLGAPLPGDLGGPILAAQQRGEQVDMPPVATPMNASDAELSARQRAMQERDAAQASRLFIEGSAPNSASIVLPDPVPATAPEAGSSTSDPRQAFLAQTNETTQSAHRLTAPGSGPLLQAGSVIPAALVTGIRSDLPGQIVAQVTRNVYDSLDGTELVIPQGSRLIGTYHSDIAAGQSRVLLAWDRLILPDGSSLLLDRLPGADSQGYAGLQDKTNYHWGNVVRASLVSTLLGVGAELGSGDDSGLARALRRGTEDSISRTGEQIVGRELSVPPTLTIRPGYPLVVMVTRDIMFNGSNAGVGR